MTKKQIFAVEHLLAKGITFDKDMYQLNSDERAIILEEAEKYKYRPRDNGSSIGTNKTMRFYNFMQGVYPRYKKIYCNW